MAYPRGPSEGRAVTPENREAVRAPRRKVAHSAAGAVALALTVPLAQIAQAAPAPREDQTPQRYIVQMAGSPVASYKGGVAGIAATRPGKGQKIDKGAANTKAYQAHLRKTQRDTLRAAGVAESALKADYTVALNGFSATMTPAQAAELRRTPGVVHVWENEVRLADTVTTPAYLGMSGAAGVWAKQFGSTANAGKGIVIGDIDSGIDPGNPSFAAMPGATVPAGFTCDKGDDPTFACNNKIVGARYYGTEYDNVVQYDHNSPRDTNGHGTHTASTAAGNTDVQMTVLGTDMGKGSGMAPAAQVSVYKALWQTSDGRGSGTSAALVQAIEDATADGVDVINYSVSGSSVYVVSPEEIAFLGAADAGIFISTSAGNSGDTVGVSSVAHNAPWTTTVAASSHNRGATKTVTLGDGTTYTGVGVGLGVGPAPLVSAAAIALPGVDPAKAALCLLDADNDAATGVTPTLDPAKAAGRIVICDRGVSARTDKSQAVKNAGGIGMVQTNTTDAQSLNGDFHSVPSIHVNATSGAKIKAYAASATAPTATISAVSTDPVDAPSMAGFSSYGPALAGEGDLLKPDITAPGVDVIAAISQDPKTGAPRFDAMSGTSMSAPHISGLAALMKQKFPTWSPAAIKSAMMTTARQTTNDGKPIQWAEGDATPLNFGAGEVVPARAYNPGLVYEAGLDEWLTYACSIDQLQIIAGPEACAQTKPTDPSDLNYPTIAIGALAGKQTVTRTVTNVEKKATQYTATVKATAGTKVTVSPTSLTVPPGQSRSFTVTIERTTAALDDYTFGQLVWTGNRGQSVQSQIAVRPVALAAAQEAVATGATGSTALTVTPGFTGTVSTDVDGLVASTQSTVQVVRKDGSVIDGYQAFTVPTGTRVTRVATYADEVPAKDIDLNLYRVAADGTVKAVGSAGQDGSSEMFTGVLAPGDYIVAVDLFSNEAHAAVPLHVWNLGDQATGNLTVTPAQVPAASGVAATVTASWSGLEAGKHYLGQVNFLDGSKTLRGTLLTVDA